MSFNVLVITEDFTKDEQIFKPLAEHIFKIEVEVQRYRCAGMNAYKVNKQR